jgi:predicted N-acetyltransferase YhbS/ribosomal protein S18 acetylase RimI-like enzyme
MLSDLTLRATETPDEFARLHQFIAAQGEEAARSLARHLARPRYRPALTRIAERADVVVGCALIAHRRLRLGAATLEIGEIERIDAPDDGDGFATLLGDCLGTLLDQGLPLATIRGDTAVYAPFGFATYAFSAALELDIGDMGHAEGSLRPASEDDLDDLAALYATSYRDLPLSEARAAPDWRAWLADGYEALVLADGRGRVVGYARLPSPTGPLSQPRERGRQVSPSALLEEENCLSVAEAAAADAGAARSLIAALAARAQARGLRQLRLLLAPAHIAAQAALHLGGAARITVTPDDARHASLAGVVDLPGMLEALAPEFERRLAVSRYAGWSGNLRVEIETERITLALDTGRAAVIDGSRPTDVRLRQVALPALAQLCLGYRAAADLRATGGLACDDSALGLIDALFPVVMSFGD